MNAYAIPGIKPELKIYIKNIQASEIVKICCNYFDRNFDELESANRERDLVYVRDLTIYTLLESTSLSLKAIGKIFNRDHTSIIHAREKVKANLFDSRYIFHERYLKDYGNILRRLNKQ